MPTNQEASATGNDDRQILGIRFYVGPLERLLRRSREGGLIVVPSAPVLVGLKSDPAHREALEKSDLAITDSGFMVLLWLAFQRERLVRISGLRFIRALLLEPEFKAKGNSFWVMPSREDAMANCDWLNTQGFSLGEADCHVAPQYARTGPLEDATLLAMIEGKRPPYIMLNLGGGVQERLGYYLRKNLGYRPAIVCTGAAIAFLSGRQARIPGWADRLFLGWLLRSLSEPAKFLPRYWQSLRLVPLLWKHRARSVAD